ncbi:SDR family NAD(P)-dependent oxidoreductase [Microlunatus speluncae]|uniref:SDR family NAD(P)-dependent oxidoreductase n=1 Tax=Microlunatus speluncae TaxID=2594267 RepID=UPI00126651D3|nr:SDR family oxidoreductase [Microlunatus speluncae]
MIDFSLAGRTALVTGASRGLGQAIADGLAELGATVYGTSRSAGAADKIAERYGTAPCVLDLTRPETFAELAERLDDVDLLINNGGMNVPEAAVDVRVEDYDAVMATNLRGTFFLTTAFGRRWIESGRAAAVINVGSQTGTVAIEERSVYGASKAALDNLTKTLALEWGSHGIRVNAIAPTWIRTELTESTLSRPEWAAELLGRIPLGRFGEPIDVVGAVAFLAGPMAGLITGHTLLIDGGYTIR